MKKRAREYESALVLGFGRSGQSAARMLASEGTRVTVVDRRKNGGLKAAVDRFEEMRVKVLLGAEELPVSRVDVCVVSPGVADDSEWVKGMRARGIACLAEIEIAAARCACPILAVTGTNGKSTCVRLCKALLESAGLRVAEAGNCGIPLSDLVDESDSLAWLIVEVSSFQLETVQSFHPRVGVLLNLQPDHLDRHGDMKTYEGLKRRLFARMGKGDTAIVPETWPLSAAVESRVVRVGRSESADVCLCRRADGFHVVREAVETDLSGSLFNNEPFGEIAAAALAAVDACGAAIGGPERVLREFEGLEHRMQTVAVINGVRYVNDSKATNLAALRAALSSVEGPVRLIAGGLLKEKKLDSTKESLEKCVNGAYFIGKAAQEMFDAWEDACPCRICSSLGEAVSAASEDAVSGETVLLAPGCASFDQFRDFEDRGNQFIEQVGRLHKE